MAEPERGVARVGPSPNRQRAQRLLVGGLVGGHLAGVVAAVAVAVASGVTSGLAAVIAAVVVIAFFTIGQGVQVAVAECAPRQVLVASLASYALRVGVLGAALMTVLGNTERFRLLDPVALVVGTVATVIGWLVGELRVFSRLRIPVYDSTEQNTTTQRRV